MGGGNGQQPRGPKLLPPPLHPPHRVSKFRQRWVLSVGLISSIPAHPQFPGDTCKIPSVGWGGKWAQVALTRQLLWRKAGTFLQRFSTPKPPWPAPSRASPPPPPTLLLAAALKPGRGFLLRELGLASTLQGFSLLRHLCQGWGSGVLFPHPQPPPPHNLGEESEGGVSWRGGSREEGWGDAAGGGKALRRSRKAAGGRDLAGRRALRS